MDVSLLIRLIDQVTGPAGKVKAALGGIKSAAGEMKAGFAGAIRQGFSVENVDNALRDAETSFRAAGQRLRGALAMGLALAAPVISLGRFEDRLVAFGNVAGIFGDDLQKIESELRTIGPAVNKTAAEMLDALEYLVGKGLSPEEGMKAIRSVGMTATATGAQVLDMAASGFSALDNLKVPAEQLQLAFDAMAEAGKRGGFELDGMAQYFPSLTAAAQALGMDGVDAVAELAAALQIARKGAGDEAETANNMRNFLSKLSSPETVKRFSDMGVDIKAEFQKAADSGVSVFEHMLALINRITDGDQFRMGDLFGDMQVLNFLKPMMANLDEFREIRDAAMKASGVNEADFARVMATASATAKSLAIELDNLISNGSVLLDIFRQLAGYVLAAMRAMNDFASANPELTRTLVTAVAALMGLSIATRLVAFAFSGLRLGLVQLAALFLKFDGTGRNIATGWRVLAGAGRFLAPALALVKGALAGLGALFAGVSLPIWGMIAAIAAAGFALWKYWDRVTAFVSGFAEPFKDLFGPFVHGAIEMVGRLATGLAELVGISPSNLLAIRDAIVGMFDFSTRIEQAKQLLSSFWSWLGDFFTAETLTDGERGEIHAAGQRMAQALIDGIRSVFDMAIQPIRDLFKFAMEIEWPTPPDWLQWMIDKAGGAVGAVRDAVSGTGGTAAAAGAAVGALPPVSGGSGFQTMLDGMDQLAAGSERGGQAVQQGGENAGAALNDGAAAIRSAASALTSAAAKISAARPASGGSVGGAIQNAKAGALHEGTD